MTTTIGDAAPKAAVKTSRELRAILFSSHRRHWPLSHRPSFGGDLGWPNFGPNRLGRSVYGPYPPIFCSGVSVSVRVAAGRLLWWGGGVRCLVGVNLSSSWVVCGVNETSGLPQRCAQTQTGI